MASAQRLLPAAAPGRACCRRALRVRALRVRAAAPAASPTAPLTRTDLVQHLRSGCKPQDKWRCDAPRRALRGCAARAAPRLRLLAAAVAPWPPPPTCPDRKLLRARAALARSTRSLASARQTSGPSTTARSSTCCWASSTGEHPAGGPVLSRAAVDRARAQAAVPQVRLGAHRRKRLHHRRQARRAERHARAGGPVRAQRCAACVASVTRAPLTPPAQAHRSRRST